MPEEGNGDLQTLICVLVARPKEWRNLETGGRGRSRSLKMVPFDRSYKTFYWSAIVSIAVCCTIFKLFDVELILPYL